jgi:sugar phosphate isomerase/epimerase
MRLGVFARTFTRPTVEEVLDAVVGAGLDLIHFNFACAGLPSMPMEIPRGLAGTLGSAVQKRSLEMAAISGTFNMIHPDRKQREAGFRSLALIAANCQEMGTRVITLCTGTRNPDDMWKADPQNESADAWKEMLDGMERALEVAATYDLCLGVEPELGNVINSAARARRLLDELKSTRVKIIMDAANLLHGSEIDKAGEIWREAFDLLGRDIIIAHAKDLTVTGKFVAAGKGDLDWDLYVSLLRSVNFTGPLILHGLTEAEVTSSVRLLRSKVVSSGPIAVQGGG